MEQKELKQKIVARIKYLSGQIGKDDPKMSDRDWDIEQECLSARINELSAILVELSA